MCQSLESQKGEMCVGCWAGSCTFNTLKGSGLHILQCSRASSVLRRVWCQTKGPPEALQLCVWVASLSEVGTLHASAFVTGIMPRALKLMGQGGPDQWAMHI